MGLYHATRCSHWTVKTLDMAGINTAKYGEKSSATYGGHSTPGASTSKAKRLGVPLNLIMKQAAWRNASLFATFYDKHIEKDLRRFGEAILTEALREKDKSKKRKHKKQRTQ